MKTFKYRIYPTKKQSRLIDSQLETCRKVYNMSLELKIKTYEKDKTNLSLYTLNKLLPIWKSEDNSIRQVHSQVLQKVQERLDNAFKGFYSRVKLGQAGFPRFKSYGRFRSLEYKQSGFSISTHLDVSKIGRIKLIKHRPLLGNIKTLTITKYQTGKFFVSIVTDHSDKIKSKSKKCVGIDLGISTLATCSDKSKIQNPKFIKQSEKQIAQVHRRYSKNKTKKNKKSISLAYEKLANRREDFCHKTSNLLVKKYKTIVFEKLTQKSMNSFSPINKARTDACWAKLVNMVSYKVSKTGGQVIMVDPAYTSKTCSLCGYIDESFDLSQKQFKCSCGNKMQRDFNASLNILRRGLAS